VNTQSPVSFAVTNIDFVDYAITLCITALVMAGPHFYLEVWSVNQSVNRWWPQQSMKTWAFLAAAVWGGQRGGQIFIGGGQKFRMT